MSATEPTPAQLRAYLQGLVTSQEQRAISDFLDSHPELVDQLSEAENSDDSLLEELRHSTSAFCRESEYLQGLNAIAQSGPDSDPSEGTPAKAGEMGLVGPYRLVQRVHRRGLSVVWQATDSRDESPVAIKLLPAARLQDPVSLARFRREMNLVATLDHPNIVRCLGCGETDGVPYLVMEWLEGCDLSELVRQRGPLPVGIVCALANQAALALDFVHRHHMVHRDVKPSNLFLTSDGTVKLLDLGLARRMRADEDSLTHADQLLGTMDYMAPEQAFDSGKADIRSDIYSLGCTIYKLLSGNAPFGGDDYHNVLRKALAHASRPMPDLRASRPDAPKALAALVNQMCAKDPAQRPDSAAKVADSLSMWADALPAKDLAEIKPASALPKAWPWKRLRPWIGALVLALACATALAFMPWATAPEAERNTTGRYSLVENGGFEQGLKNWAAQVPAHSTTRGAFHPVSGKAFAGKSSARCLSVKPISGTGYAFIASHWIVTPGRRYVLSAAFETSAMTTGTLSVDLSEPTFNTRINARPGYSGWQFLWKEFTAKDDTVQVRLIHDGECPAGESGLVDAVAITPAEDF